MNILESTPEQKAKYETAINSVYSGYDRLLPQINETLLTYGRVFYDQTKGKITYPYMINKKKETKERLITLTQETYTNTVNKLNEYREQYLKECFPMTSTEDSLELDFVSKELAVMNPEELKTFYLDNILDKNKVRLFDIELKKRINSDDPAAQIVKLFRDQFLIEDVITKEIDQKIKYFDGLRQMSNSTIPLIKTLNGDLPKIQILSYDEVFRYIESKSCMNLPQSINIVELIKLEG